MTRGVSTTDILSETIFDLLQKRGSSQKKFAGKTRVAQIAISDWKRKKTNHVSKKILIICEVLGVTPQVLLAGTEEKGSKTNPSSVFIVEKESKFGQITADIVSMNTVQQERLLGCIVALREANEKNKSKEKRKHKESKKICDLCRGGQLKTSP